MSSKNQTLIRGMLKKLKERCAPNDDWDPYEGLDPRMKPPFCGFCKKKWGGCRFLATKPPPYQKVMKCSGCNVVYYCSRECQRKDRKDHKKECNEVKRRRELVKRETQKVQHLLDTPHLINQTAYVKARFDVYQEIRTIAYRQHCSENWQEICFHLQELNRICQDRQDADPFGFRMSFPAALLHLGRDDDAFAFCCYLTNRIFSDTPQTQDWERNQLSLGSKEGDWIWGETKGCRFKDFFQECHNDDDMEPSILTTIWVIKKRILSIYKTRELAFSCFLDTKFATAMRIKNEDIFDHIYAFLMGFDVGKADNYIPMMQVQEAQLNRISDVLDNVNPLVLPALRDPETVVASGRPGFFTDQLGHEVYNVMYTFWKITEVIPGLERWLDQRYG